MKKLPAGIVILLFTLLSFIAVQGTVFAQTPPPPQNNYGCSSVPDKDTGRITNYCMLAPIPGLGTPTGDVKGEGSVDVASGFSAYLANVIKLFMGIVGVIAVLMLVIGGIEYMSTVSIGEKEGAKTRITNALLGLLLALSSYVILYTINPSLTEFTIGVPGAVLTLEDQISTPTGGTGIIPPTGKTTPGLLTNPNRDKYDAIYRNAAAAAKPPIDCTWLKALAAQESGNDPTRTSPDGAQGLTQIMPDTYKKYGTGDPYDATNNANAGAKYFSSVIQNPCPPNHADCNPGDMRYALAAYNGGNGQKGANGASTKVGCEGLTAWECPQNWDASRRNSYLQTYNYVNTVMSNYAALKNANPPAGC